MAITVQTTHPVGLEKPKIIQTLVNGTTPHEPEAPYMDGTQVGTELHQSTSLGQNSHNHEDAQAVLALRNLIFDICNHNGGGHGGSALGMAAIGVVLYKYVMRYNPSDPSWFDRDRFVLSNGKSPCYFIVSKD